MSLSRTILHVAALALALTAVPLTALAEGKHGPACDEAGLVKGHKRPQFPVKADKFNELVEKRIARARKQMNRLLDKHAVPGLIRSQIQKDFDEGAGLIRAAAKRVTADGTVSRKEAKEVGELARDLRRKAQAKYAPFGGEVGDAA